MSAAKEIVLALIMGGMDAVESAALLARAVVEMSVTTETKSTSALRQKRYRERNAGVTKRNESVTERNAHESVTNVTESVTNRNESVTTLRPANNDISYLLTSSSNLEEKKESKKERVPKKRNAPLRDDWTPSLRALQVAEEHGVSAQVVEQIFRDYLKSSGKLYADYDAAFCNFLRNQRRFNGNTSHAKTESKRAGSLIDAIDRELAKVQREEDAAAATSADTVFSLPRRSVFGP